MKNEGSGSGKIFMYALCGLFACFIAYAFASDDPDSQGFNAGCHPKVSFICWPQEY